MSTLRFVGLDVHAETIVIAVADSGSAAAVILKVIGCDERRLLSELRKLGTRESLRVCYEAGPTGFGLERFLRSQGVDCVVVAPSLTPQSSGSRVKTDRRDARKLAHFLRSGDLTPIWVPDEQTESLRDLERVREDARLSERRARQQLLKFLMRHSRRFTEGKSHWTQKHWKWILQQKFAHEAQNRVLGDYVLTAQQATQRVERLTRDIQELVAGWALAPLVKNLQAFRGVELVTAVGLAAEIGDFTRFRSAGQFMAFVGLVPSENSTGKTRRQGGITKTGNAHVRRLMTEAAWHYYNWSAGISNTLRARRAGVPAEIVAIADKALRRLQRKAYLMKHRELSPKKIVIALARELAGFLWAAAVETARQGSCGAVRPPMTPRDNRQVTRRLAARLIGVATPPGARSPTDDPGTVAEKPKPKTVPRRPQGIAAGATRS
jgi:transposase